MIFPYIDWYHNSMIEDKGDFRFGVDNDDGGKKREVSVS